MRTQPPKEKQSKVWTEQVTKERRSINCPQQKRLVDDENTPNHSTHPLGFADNTQVKLLPTKGSRGATPA